MTALSERRKQAWITRREKYGPMGHKGTYHRDRTPCPDCEHMRNYLARLHVEGMLSEGQAAKAAGITRIEIRILSDNLINSGAVADTRGLS